MSGLMGTMASGMAFGVGSSVAKHAVGSMLGGGGGGDKEAAPVAAPAAPAAGACDMPQQEFMRCLQLNNNSADACSNYFQALQNCQDNAKFSSA